MDSQLREKSIHLLAFIRRGTQHLGESSSLNAPLVCPPILKEEFNGCKKPSSVDSSSAWFALSPFSCVSKPKFSAVSTTTALAIKTQSTENSVSQSYLSDTIVLQIYIITFLLLKFLCLQAEGAARRAEEVGIVANSKPCPKCKRPIEKTKGAMTCTPPCKFEFCWLCLGAWSDHGERIGGFYACNRYEAANKKGVSLYCGLWYDVTERRREMAKHSLERYTHYYECWARNQLMEKLSDIQRGPESQLKFITDTWQEL
ncbi:unnamed protein product [Prunus armeniaca]|uniref:RING-type domain-containing protein n=1 Tax=Prunus armeniaca TaxID=36596 RepID=A0A6J5TIV0_PRUAR|nr:unnamed protein product [Prunus armeniaca]